MRVSVTDAKGQLTELVRRAEAGDEVVLTRHGQPAARIVAIHRRPDPTEQRRLIAALQEVARAKRGSGADAARGQDFLYGDDGLPK